MSQNFHNQSSVFRLAVSYVLWVTGHEADTWTGSEEMGQFSLYPTPRACRADALWPQSSIQVEAPLCQATCSQTQEPGRVPVSVKAPPAFPYATVAPLLPLLWWLLPSPTRLVMISEYF